MKHLKRFRITESNNDLPSEDKASRFWDFVEEAKWKSDHNYDRIKEVLSKYSKGERSTFKKVHDFFLEDLAQRFHEDWLGDPGIEVSDDGWWDLRADVIGRGKEYYENITVEKLQDMALSHDYEENFGYCFQD